MHPILFKIGPITIYTYGVFVFLGVLAGYGVIHQAAKKQGIDSDSLANIIFWTVISSFLGAKLLYILLEFKIFLKDPLAVIRSGFVFYGGVIFGILGLWRLTRAYKIRFAKVADIIALGLPLGHAIGRIGCFFYGCCYGKVGIFPVQLVSSFALFLIFFLLLFLRRKKHSTGQIFLYYIISYSTFRFLIEFFRVDPRGKMLFLSTSQFISLILLISGIFLLYHLRKKSV
jgi:phosphatidylglycerol:prolipoprotein diacylglycerol transferase